MRLCAVILAGGNREDVIEGAIESIASTVDHVILIDTGESAYKAIQVGRKLLGDKCSVCHYLVPGDFDCATARNSALDCAAEAGFDWALMVDSDERIHGKPKDIRRLVSEAKTETILIANHESDSYRKTKFFRLPRTGFWSGPVHEAFVTGPVTFALGITFSEVPKTPEVELTRMVWIERKCSQAIVDDPGNSRWYFYRGDARAALGQPDEAVTDFLEASRISTWDEERSWSRYRAAVIRCEQGRFEEAVTICLESALDIPELAWYAAFSLHKAGQHDRSIYWAQRAARVGREQRKTERAGFVYKPAWFEAPYDVMRWAYKALGETEMEDQALQMVAKMATERLGADGIKDLLEKKAA